MDDATEPRRAEDSTDPAEPVAPPPPAPGLVEHFTEAGGWLFRRRSHLPVLVLAGVLAVVASQPMPLGGWGALGAWITVGVALGLAGLVIRGWAIGLVPSGTSGRGTQRFRAESLNTTGLYSLVRHPLYLGNALLWLGVVATSGRLEAILGTGLVFWLYYERIMVAEERFLFERFPDRFARWARRTPAFIPRFGRWIASDHSFSLRHCLGRDYQAMYGFVAASASVEITPSPMLSRMIARSLKCCSSKS